MVVEAQWDSCDDEVAELDVPQGLFEEVGRVLRRLPSTCLPKSRG
jgi:hypothetical protein